MIDKFNFYDIYGYLLPGLALLGVLWLPFGLVAHIWPKSDWGSALITLALAYIVGHLIQYVVQNVIPSHDIKNSPNKDRHPSETVLDPGNTELSPEVKAKIASAVKMEFGLDLNIKDTSGNDDRVRKDAFLLARQRLIREKAANYAEQFQGMYALTRGLTAVLAVGAVYFAGWAFSVLRGTLSFLVAFLLMSVALFGMVSAGCALLRVDDRTIKKQLERAYAVWLLILLCVAGYLLGLWHEIRLRECALIATFATVAFLGCLRCYDQYRYFAVRFAITVWRDFLAYSEKDKSTKSSFVFE